MARHHARFLGSARLIAVCTFISRLTGLARDIVLNHCFGQNWVQDAFNYGFLIPNLFRRLFGEGALSAVFVPVFTEVLTHQGRQRARLLLGRVTGLMVLALVTLMILLELGVFSIATFSHGGAMRHLQISLTAVMLPFMVGICLVALFSSILNCVGHFTIPAILPIVLNILIILGVVQVGPMFGESLDRQVYGPAICVIVAGLLQLAIILPVLRGHDMRFRLSLDHHDADLRKIGRLFIPVMLGQGVLLFNVFFDAQICTLLTRGPGSPETFTLFGHVFVYPLARGALSAVNNAQRLYQFPLGVLAISLATAAFPTFSRFAAEKNIDGLRAALAQALRLAIFVGLPSGLMLMILGKPIISLLFEHGRFGPAETLRAAAVLRWYGLGMVAFCAQHILLRGFYSLKDTRTPMRISCSLVVINAAINLVLIWHPQVRESTFGISTAITSAMHVCISLWLLRRRLGGHMGARAILVSVGKTTLATAAASIAAFVIHHWVVDLDLESLGHTAVAACRVFLPMAGAVGSFFAIGGLLRMEEIGWLFKRNVRTP